MLLAVLAVVLSNAVAAQAAITAPRAAGITVPRAADTTVPRAAAVPDTEPPFYVGDVAVAGERVVELPEDGHAWYTTLYTEAQPTARDRTIAAWFDGDAELKKLRQQTHFNVYRRGCSVWARYANLTAVLPCVTVQTKDGTVVFKASGNSCHLDNVAGLTRAIAVSIRGFRQLPDTARPCPCPEPGPNPPYNPDPGPFGPKPFIPDIGPHEPPDDEPSPALKQEEHDAWRALAVMGLVAVGGYVVFQWKEKV